MIFFHLSSLHWCGGLKVLANASQVREFSPFEAAPPAIKKAIFIGKHKTP
jgi:hypothetical protein